MPKLNIHAPSNATVTKPRSAFSRGVYFAGGVIGIGVTLATAQEGVNLGTLFFGIMTVGCFGNAFSSRRELN